MDNNHDKTFHDDFINKKLQNNLTINENENMLCDINNSNICEPSNDINNDT